ncbi:Uncharacterised protein [Bordetella pertussis]|nr:Uncharacterised protein [Bordetella pertussis]
MGLWKSEPREARKPWRRATSAYRRASSEVWLPVTTSIPVPPSCRNSSYNAQSSPRYLLNTVCTSGQ